MRDPEHRIAQAFDTTAEALVLTLDGDRVSIPWAACSTKLADADAAQRERIELSPSGYGLHWPSLDEDLSVDGLLRSLVK